MKIDRGGWPEVAQAMAGAMADFTQGDLVLARFALGTCRAFAATHGFMFAVMDMFGAPDGRQEFLWLLSLILSLVISNPDAMEHRSPGRSSPMLSVNCRFWWTLFIRQCGA